MIEYPLTLSHRPSREGVVSESAHMPFFEVLELMYEAWRLALWSACEDTLLPAHLGVVHVTSDFAHEIFLGESLMRVRLVDVGTSSLRFHVELRQNGRLAASVTTVLARVNETREHSVPLSLVQRAGLDTILEQRAS
ncbi:MAG: hypothetical protein JWO63_826 [Frankiales bacterium]|jgi:acyl-CoA thioesterase FadM|nr:hypothetical protein [Frankiales bacterium]